MAPGYIIVWRPPASCGHRICTEFNLSTYQGYILISSTGRTCFSIDGWVEGQYVTQEPYGLQYMKKLQEYFNEKLFFTNLDGRTNIITFRINASTVQRDNYKKSKCDNVEEETKCFGETAAKIIRNDIKVLYWSTNYPNVD